MMEVEVIKALCNVHGEYNVFSKVLDIVAVHSKHNRALTVVLVCQGSATRLWT
jgi:hypothetical protein